jgi:putative glutamine amidotransferase
MNKIALAYPAFEHSFLKHYPDLIVTNDTSRLEKEKVGLIIFPGGEDIFPGFYNQKSKYTAIKNCSMRDMVEQNMFNYAIDNNIKMLGICRGHQLINALLGGDLVQDLYFNLGVTHSYNHELIFNNENSIVRQFFENGVNSMHHQGVVIPGFSLKETSKYNGVIESTESDKIISVQFHPEFMESKESRNFFSYIREVWMDKKVEPYDRKQLLKEKKTKLVKNLEDFVLNPFEERPTYQAIASPGTPIRSNQETGTYSTNAEIIANAERITHNTFAETVNSVTLNANTFFTTFNEIDPTEEETNH